MKSKYILGKCDYSNNGRKAYLAEVEWELKDGRFSASAGIWNTKHTDYISCGQMLNDLIKYFPHDQKLRRIVKVWERWHLNDMKAACVHQRAYEWDKRPINPDKPTNTYGKHFPGQRTDSWNMLGWVSPQEHPEGLLGKPCSWCGYKYGTAWLKEEIPQNVIDEILSW